MQIVKLIYRITASGCSGRVAIQYTHSHFTTNSLIIQVNVNIHFKLIVFHTFSLLKFSISGLVFGISLFAYSENSFEGNANRFVNSF